MAGSGVVLEGIVVLEEAAEAAVVLVEGGAGVDGIEERSAPTARPLKCPSSRPQVDVRSVEVGLGRIKVLRSARAAV